MWVLSAQEATALKHLTGSRHAYKEKSDLGTEGCLTGPGGEYKRVCIPSSSCRKNQTLHATFPVTEPLLFKPLLCCYGFALLLPRVYVVSAYPF